MDLATKERAYGTWLGFYKGFAGKLGWDSAQLVAGGQPLLRKS